jgi:hypothetical protein
MRLTREQTRARNRLRNSKALRRRVLDELNARLHAQGKPRVSVDVDKWLEFFKAVWPYIKIVIAILAML